MPLKRHTGKGFTWYWTPDIWLWNPADGPWQPEHGQPKTNVYFELSCHNVDPRHAYDYWREVAFPNFSPDARPADSHNGFVAEAKGFITPRAQLYTYRSEAISGERSARYARSDRGRSIDIGLIISGTRFYDSKSDPHSFHLAKPGSFFVYDPTRPCRTQWQAHRGTHLSLDRTMVERALGCNIPDPSQLARLLDASRMAPFVKAQLLLIVQNLRSLSDFERTYLTDNTVNLLLTALRNAADGSQQCPPSPDNRKGIFVAAQRYIDGHLGEPTLSADQIAMAIGCSRSTLYRAFNEHRVTVADFIKERRFQLFWHLLQSCPAHTTITDLAHRCGFGDLTHFSKIFKRRFGISPKEARRLSLDSTSEDVSSCD